MIIKGAVRSGAYELGIHLLNSVENEHVDVWETRGMISNSLCEGFHEWEIIASQSKATKCFYSLSINPNPVDRALTQQEWKHSIELVETRLGLTGQPRAVVCHEKIGDSDGKIRKHVHVVWSRIDGHTLKAKHHGHDYFKLMSAAKTLASEFGLSMPDGFIHNQHKNDNFDHALSHAKDRDPDTAKHRKSQITKIWHEYETGDAFVIALQQAGYVLAQGEKKRFVIVDREEQIFALGRLIDDAKAADVKAKLGCVSTYPRVEEAKEQQKIRKYDGEQIKANKENQRQDISREQRLYHKLTSMARRFDILCKERLETSQRAENDLHKRQAQETKAFKRKQRAETAHALRNRSLKKPQGVVKKFCYFARLTHVLTWLDNMEDNKRAKYHTSQMYELCNKHSKENGQLQRKKAIFERQRKKEAECLERLRHKLRLEKEKADLMKRPAILKQFKAISTGIA